MLVEQSGVHIPRHSVDLRAMQDDDNPRARADRALLNQLFPEPEPRVAGKNKLRQLGCPEEYLSLIQSLNTPREIQSFISTTFTYNQSETTRSVRGILESPTHSAHCFEGALFAYALLCLHGWKPPGIVLLQAGENIYGADHNFVPYRYKNRLGSLAMSAWPTLQGKSPVFSSLRDLVLGGYYYQFKSEIPKYQGVWNLVGYSDVIDIVAKFGTDWMFRPGDHALDEIYHGYAKNLTCTHLFNHSRYPYIDEEPGARVKSSDGRSR